MKLNGRAYFDCSFPGCRAGLEADYTDKESSNSEEPVPDLATLDPPEAHVGRDGLQHPVQVDSSAWAWPSPQPARCQLCPGPHQPTVSFPATSSSSWFALLIHIVVFMNNAFCFHNDHDRHRHHVVLVCPGLYLDQRTPPRTPRKTLCLLLQGSLSSCGQGERGQSALSVGRIYLLVISLEILGTCTRAIPCQRSEKKGHCRKVDFCWWNVKDNKANWWFWPFFEQLL